LVEHFPCVGLIGPRQSGKTTLVKRNSNKITKQTLYLDLELSEDFHKLNDAQVFLQQHQDKCVIIDEIQRKPDLFPLLRALIDQKRESGRFILLGSASPDLIRDSSESLAGRIAYLELHPFILPEIKFDTEKLWFRGGFPDSYLENKPNIRYRWMDNFIRTYLEKDLPQLGFGGHSAIAERLWIMLAHEHGNLINYSELSKSLEISMPTVKSYMDFLEQAFLIRQLKPYTHNIKKRMVKSPKVYIRDSGILHHLLGLKSHDDLYANIKMGNSWEGFVIEQISALLPLNRKMYFYRTHVGSELDLVIEKGGKPHVGIEIKYGSDISPSKGNIYAANYLKTNENFIIIISKDEEYLLSNGFKVVGIRKFLTNILPSL